MQVSGSMAEPRTKGLVFQTLLVLFLLASLPGCGGKYEMPTETFKDAYLGEYHYSSGYGWFEGATHMAMIYGHIYVAFSDEGTVRRYYGDGLPEKDIVFSGLERPFVVGVGSGGVAVADSTDGITVKVYDLDGGAPILTFSDPEWKSVGGLATDDMGNIYVSDMVRNFVRSYNTSGNQRFGTDLADSGFGIGHVLSPHGLWVVDDTLFIAESNGEKSQVQKISTTEPQKGIMFSGEVPLLSSFTDENGDEWTFMGPSAVTTDIDGNVYVLDKDLGKLFRFKPDGVSDEMVNSPEAAGPQSLSSPVSIGQYKRRIYTLERDTGTIHRWDSRS
jgi:outer membrane protein assembly factor BamB